MDCLHSPRDFENEKYTGDILFQKTYTDSQFNRHTNRGEKDMYYMEGHHPAIVSRETFEAVAAVIGQRGKEKSVTQGNKYQNRYPFSGKIICGECGSSFKRRIHYSTHQKYIAWCCSKHIEHIEDCSMQFIRQDAVETAFMTMMNKLAYAHRRILQPLRDALRRVDDAEGFRSIEEPGKPDRCGFGTGAGAIRLDGKRVSGTGALWQREK